MRTGDNGNDDDGDDDVGDEQVGTGQLISSTAKQLKPAGILD